ncbi:MAG: ribosome maturation factor RimM, partial [Rhizobiales bacterium]|nr:ribosome maturation factor RimM [Hyphomicrobiales bacterium]
MAGARICLGQIGAPHGVRGEVRLHSFTADPTAIATYGPLETEDGRVFTIETLRPAKHALVAKLTGVADREAAERLTNTKLYVPRERLPEPAQPDEFYHADLIGLRAVDRAGREWGTVVAVHNFGAGDLIELRPANGAQTELLPFDAATVPEVNVRGGTIVINPSPLVGEDGKAKLSRVRGSARKGPLTR